MENLPENDRSFSSESDKFKSNISEIGLDIRESSYSRGNSSLELANSEID